MARVISTLRNHLHFLVVVSVLIAAMTWPTIRYVFDTEVFWLPTKVYDVWINFWDAWHFELFMTGNAELLFTDLIFYPNGVSLAFDTPTYTHISGLQHAESVPATGSNAYNLDLSFDYLRNHAISICLSLVLVEAQVDQFVRCDHIRLQRLRCRPTFRA